MVRNVAWQGYGPVSSYPTRRSIGRFARSHGVEDGCPTIRGEKRVVLVKYIRHETAQAYSPAVFLPRL